MIKVDDGEIQISGECTDILSEVAMLLHCVKDTLIEEEGEEHGLELYNKAVELGGKSHEEIREEAIDALFNLMERMFK